MQPAPSCPLCVGHMHTSYYFFVICSEMGNRCSDVSKHVQTQTTETVFTQEDAPSSSLDVSAFSSVLCQDDPTVFVCWGRPIHDGQTSSLCFFLCAFTALAVWPVTCGRCVSDVCRPHTSSFVLYLLRTHCAEICNVFSSFWINLLVQKFHFMSNCGTFHGFYFTKFTPLKLQYQNLKCAQRRITGCTKSSMFEFPSASIRSSSHSRAEVGDPAAIFLQKYQDIFKSCLLVCVWVNVSARSFVGHGADE